jgi:4-alpha-glucanotransferase
MKQDPDNQATQVDCLAGVCMHITSLPGPYGIGEIGRQARDFVDRLREMGLAVWQFLPTGPTAFGDSPYQPLSTFAGNEMLIDIGELVETGFLSQDEVAPLTALPHDTTDYGALIPAKRRLLDVAATRIGQSAGPASRDELRQFIDEHDGNWLHDYALFRVLKSRHDERPWPEWLPEYVHRDKSAMQDLEAAAASEIAAIKIMQWIFHRQWHALHAHARNSGVSLFGDVPIYIALDSADAWANRNLLQIDDNGRPNQVAGVPPDYFSEDGQLWGNPLYAWEHHERSGYAWWIERLRAATSLVDLVRIDHFRGFEAYWSVPADAVTARTGTWEPGPGDAIFDALRSALGELPIVAENLGMITTEVEALRNRHRFPGMHVLQFEICNDGFDPADIESNSVCYTGTHDNDTTVGWFRGSPDDCRTVDEINAAQEVVLRLTDGAPETIHLDLVRKAFESAASLAIAPLQDYLGLGSEARMNTPGTTENNWRWRVDVTQIDDTLCDNVAAMVASAGRMPAAPQFAQEQSAQDAP